MANNEINIRFKVADDGTLKVIAKDAGKASSATDALASSTDRATRSKNSYNKAEKGAAGLTSNSTKAFAKQAQTIGGSSGLVAAYATLAANVFAITAAFGALRRAAAVEQMTAAVDRLGISAGKNLLYLRDSLVDISDGALSAADALNSVSVGFSAGFDASEIQGLTKIARGASLALGRDMTDAMTRLTRGAAKLEPELLDELGIMVRVDEAATRYGASIGKTADQLNSLEKRQAFLNAVLEQGAAKYKNIYDVAEVNPYDKLAASFDNLTKTIFNGVNTVLTPAITLLADNVGLLTAAGLGVFSTFSRQMIPSLVNGAQAATEMGDKLADAAMQQARSIKVSGQLAKQFSKDLSPAIQAGAVDLDTYDKAIERTDATLSRHREQLKNYDKDAKGYEARAKTKTRLIQEEERALHQLRAARAAEAGAMALHSKANALEAASKGQLIVAYKALTQSVREYHASQTTATVGSGIFSKALVTLRTVSFATTAGLAALGAVINAALGWIMLLVTAGSLLKMAWDWLTEPSEIQKAGEKVRASLDSMNKATLAYKGVMEGNGTVAEKAIETNRILAGTYEEMKARIVELNSVQDESRNKALVALNNQIKDAEDRVRDTSSAGFDSTGEFDDSAGYENALNALNALKAEREELFRRSSQGILSQEALDENVATLQLMQANMKGFAGEEGKVSILANLIKGIQNGTVTSSATITAVLEGMGAEAVKTRDAYLGMDSATSELATSLSQLGKQAITPFDDVVAKTKVLVATMKDLSPEEQANKIKTMGEAWTSVFGKNTGANAATKFYEDLQGVQTVLIESKGKIKELEESSKDLANLAKQYSSAYEDQVDILNQITKQKVLVLAMEKHGLIVAGKSEEAAERIRQIDSEINGLGREIISNEEMIANSKVLQIQEAERLFQVESKTFNLRKSYNTALMQEERIRKQLQNYSDASRSTGSALTAKDELELFEQQKVRRLKAIEDELAIKLQGIELEYDLLEAKAALLKIEAANQPAIQASLDKYIEALDKQEAWAKDSAIQQASTETAGIGLEGIQKTEAVQAAVLGASGSTTAEIIKNQGEAGGIDSLANPEDKIAAVSNAMAPMMEQLKALGPEGELVSSVAQGALTMAESWQGVATSINAGATGMQKGAAIAGAVATSIGQIGNMLNANSQARIASIDKEIAAEQKRDGKSAQSVAKIKALEAKKEAAKRKAFETDKKVKMATTIASTATAVMQTLAQGGLYAIPIASMIGAMGAAQLAIISGTSYDGGGSSAGANVPSAISMGDRKNSVDLAKSTSASSELAYARGADGTGNMTNFRPAFTGYKNRASGGNTGFLVGEQGPELFIPERSGTIMPADETASVGGTVNANITIQAVDAAGVQDVLMKQRGHIIGMLREAANAHGETFLESVSTMEK